MILCRKENELKRLDKVSIEHLDYRESNGSFCPIEYSVRAIGKDCEIEYEVKIILRDKIQTWGYPDWLLKVWAPDMSLPLIDAEGVIREKNGDSIKETSIQGKGIFEFGMNHKNPFNN